MVDVLEVQFGSTCVEHVDELVGHDAAADVLAGRVVLADDNLETISRMKREKMVVMMTSCAKQLQTSWPIRNSVPVYIRLQRLNSVTSMCVKVGKVIKTAALGSIKHLYVRRELFL